MIGLVLSLLAGLAFGYLAVGPANRGYTPRAWGVLVGVLAFTFGFVLFSALVLATLFAPPTGNLSIVNLVIAQGFWAAYSASAALGAYIQQRRRRP